MDLKSVLKKIGLELLGQDPNPVITHEWARLIYDLGNLPDEDLEKDPRLKPFLE